MYRSYSYNNMPEPIKQKPPPKPEAKKAKPEKNASAPLLGNMEVDDIILLAVIFMLILNDCDDKLLLIALAYIFLSDYVN